MATSNNLITLRRHDLDNLRTFLTGLVTVHHTSIAYGGLGGWPVKSAAFARGSPLTIGFNMFNQSFFMGSFFWVSGYVSAQSLEKTANYRPFLKNKILRLGIPTLVYTLILNPMTQLMALPTWDRGSVVLYLSNYYTNLNSVRGPVWYTATLLCFDVVAVLVRKFSRTRRNRPSHPDHAVHYNRLKRYGWIAVALCSFLIKTKFPLGTYLPIIRLQPPHALQYVYAYTLGHLAYKANDRTMKGPFDPVVDSNTNRELNDKESIDDRPSTRISLLTAVGLSVASMTLIPGPRYLDSTDWVSDTIEQGIGGWNMPSFLYALWNELAFNLLAPSLMSYFDQWYNKPATSSTWNPRYSYATFLIHTPVCVAIEILVEKALIKSDISTILMNSQTWRNVGPIIMTAIVGLSSAWVSAFIGNKLLESLPFLRKII